MLILSACLKVSVIRKKTIVIYGFCIYILLIIANAETECSSSSTTSLILLFALPAPLSVNLSFKSIPPITYIALAYKSRKILSEGDHPFLR